MSAHNVDLVLPLEGGGKITLSCADRKLHLCEANTPKSTFSAWKKSILKETSPPLWIPLDDLLWVGTNDGDLAIDYAVRNSKHIKPARLLLGIDKSSSTAAKTEAFVQAALSQSYSNVKIKKKALVLVNPHAGPGQASQSWALHVKPLFQAARIRFNVIFLHYAVQAIKIVQEMQLDDYDIIVACSGDGIPHEIFNGLSRRADAQTALAQVAVCHIPCGSGNAMSYNLYMTNVTSEAALAIIKGTVTPLDLMSITLSNGTRLVSFLSQSIGLIADCDLGTENLRWMGKLRFELGYILRVLRKNSFSCDLAVQNVAADKATVVAYYDSYRRAKQNSSQHMADHALAIQEKCDFLKLKHGTVSDTLSEEWEIIHNPRLLIFYSGKMPYMSSGAEFFKAALPQDGCLDLVIVEGDLDIVTAIRLLLCVKSGKLFQHKKVQYRKVSAYRITPRDQEGGYISIDGESVPFGPFQVETHQQLGRVVCNERTFTACRSSREMTLPIE